MAAARRAAPVAFVVAALGGWGCAKEEVPPQPTGSGPSAQPTSSTGANPSAGSAGAGASAVGSRKCTDCHGANMAGGGPLPGFPGTELYAPNLTPDQETGVGSWTDAQLRLAIREGLDKEGMVLCPQMQHYRTMPDEELASVVAYLRSLPPVKNAVKKSICPPLKR